MLTAGLSPSSLVLAEMEASSGITGTSRLGQSLAWLYASEGGRRQ